MFVCTSSMCALCYCVTFHYIRHFLYTRVVKCEILRDWKGTIYANPQRVVSAIICICFITSLVVYHQRNFDIIGLQVTHIIEQIQVYQQNCKDIWKEQKENNTLHS